MPIDISMPISFLLSSIAINIVLTIPKERPEKIKTIVPKTDQRIANVTSGYGILPTIGNSSTWIDNAVKTGRNEINVITESTI